MKGSHKVRCICIVVCASVVLFFLWEKATQATHDQRPAQPKQRHYSRKQCKLRIENTVTSR
eukprot:366102-Chlamydomonas_euryale.AAC.12